MVAEMKYRSWSVLMILAVAAGLVQAQDTAAPPLQVGGVGVTARTWTAAQVKQELATDVSSVEYTTRGQKHTSNCVPLLSVVKAAGVAGQLKMDPNMDPKLKNAQLRLAVVVRGGDGYTAAFSVAELLPEVGGAKVWLAVDMDGAALPARDGAIKLIVPSDQKPGRWVRGVSAITVVDVTQAAAGATTQSAAAP